MLRSDLVTYSGMLSSGPSVNGSEGGSVDFEMAKEDLQANMLYSDYNEILVTSSTSSATGQERKGVHDFGFHRVIFFLSSFYHAI